MLRSLKPPGASVMVPLSLVLLYRGLWKARWFWLSVASFLAVHLCFLAMVDWSVEHEPSRSDALLVGIDLLLSVALVASVQRLIQQRRGSHP